MLLISSLKLLKKMLAKEWKLRNFVTILSSRYEGHILFVNYLIELFYLFIFIINSKINVTMEKENFNPNLCCFQNPKISKHFYTN